MVKDFYSTKYAERLYASEISPNIEEWAKREESYLAKNVPGNCNVLEVGCGFGRVLEILAIKPGIALTGIDKSKKMIKMARNKLDKFSNIRLMINNSKNTGLPSNSFDYTLCVGNTFGNMTDPNDMVDIRLDALQEMKRVTKPGGKIIISVYSENALKDRILDYAVKTGLNITRIDPDGTVHTKEGLIVTQFTKERLQKMFEQVGLKCKIKNLNRISYLCESQVIK